MTHAFVELDQLVEGREQVVSDRVDQDVSELLLSLLLFQLVVGGYLLEQEKNLRLIIELHHVQFNDALGVQELQE